MKLFVGTKGLVIHDGKILLLRESDAYADGTEKGKWDVPGGRIEPEEALLDGLAREVKEESGLDIVPDIPLGAHDAFPVLHGESCHIVRIYFLCTAAQGDVVLSRDHDAYAWVTPEEALEYHLVSDIDEVVARYVRIGA